MNTSQKGYKGPNPNRPDPDEDQNDPADYRPEPDVYHGNSNTATQTFIDLICTDRKQAEGDRKTNRQKYQTSRETTNHRICLLNKAEATAGIYRQIDNCVATMAAQATAAIQTNVNGLATKDKDTGKGDVLKKQLKDAIDALKEVNTKMGDMARSAKLLNDTFEDASQTENRQALLKSFPHIHDEFKKFVEQADNCNKRIDATLNDAFIMSGIQTFLNLPGLTDFATRLTSAVTNFKIDITGNNAQAATHITEAQTTLTEALKNQIDNKVALFNTCVSLDDLERIRDFVCNPERLMDFTVSCIPTPQLTVPAEPAADAPPAPATALAPATPTPAQP